MTTIIERSLRIPLLAKVAGANLLIVATALMAVGVERRQTPSANAVPILGIALALSLVVNLVLIYVALRPLTDLEITAARLSGGDIEARVPSSRLADRAISHVGETLNTLLDRLTADRARERLLAAQVIDAQDAERARVARELHDSTAQILAALMMQLAAASRESNSPLLDERIATLRELAAEALEEVRALSHNMHPRVLDDLGLAAALEWIGRQTGEQTSIDVHVSATEIHPPLGAHLAAALYRVAQEGIRNVVRHSQARHLDVRLRSDALQAVLEISDDGKGFDVERAEARRPGMGLFSMRERMTLVDGTLSIRSMPGDGATITAIVPLTP